MRRSVRISGLVFGSLFVAAAFVAAACSDDQTYDTTEDPTTATEIIGPAGGTIVAADGTTLLIPAGALNENISITIAPNETAPLLSPSTATAVGTAHIFGPEGQQFLKPVTVTLAFDPANIPAGGTASQIVVYTAPLSSSDYQALPTILTDSSHVTGTTTHFCNMIPGWTSSAADAGVTDGGHADASLDAQTDAADGADATSDAGAPDAAFDANDANATDAADAADAHDSAG